MQENSEAQKLADLFAGCSQLSYGITVDKRNPDGTLARDPDTGKVISEHDEHIRKVAALIDYVNHLAGKVRLGLVPTTIEGFSTFGGIDIDTYGPPPVGYDSWVAYWKYQVATFKLHHLNVYATRSGGVRIAVFYQDPIPTISLRVYLRWVVKELLALPATTEIFPKQDNIDGLAEDGKPKLGNYLFLPFYGEGKVGEVLYSDPPPDVRATLQEVEKKDAAYGLRVRDGVDPVALLLAAGLKWRPAPEHAGIFTLNYHIDTGKCLLKGSLHTTCGNATNPRTARFIWDSSRRLLYHQCFDTDCQQIAHRTRVALENFGIDLATLLDFSTDYSDQTLLDNWVEVDKGEVRYLDADRVYMLYDRAGLWSVNHTGPKEKVSDFLKGKSPGVPTRCAAVDLVEARQADAQAKQQAKLDSRLKSSKTVAALLYLAPGRHELKAHITDFDPDPNLLALSDGSVIDLRNRNRRPATARDLITKRVTVSPDFRDYALSCPLFMQFLCEVQPIEAVRGYMQRLAGYWLTAETIEQIVSFFIGVGGGGKNTYLKLFESIFGPYYRSISLSTLVAGKDDAYRQTERGQLPGVRLGAISETPEKTVYDSNTLKELSGEGKLNGRRRYEDSFDFVPLLKTLIIANSDPRLDQVDFAVRRRVQVVRFTQKFGGKERADIHLWEKLRHEYPGILAWMINGSIAWQKTGLLPPKEVLDASEAYLAGADLRGNWLTECCTFDDPNCFTPSDELYQNWSRFCRGSGCEKDIGTLTQFVSALKEKRPGNKHDRKTRAQGGSGFWGIALLPEAERESRNWLEER